MRMDPGLDTGPVIAQRSEPVRPDDTAQSLSERLARLGAALLTDVLPGYLAGRLTPQPQDNARATYAPQLRKDDGHLDFSQSAVELARRVRALSPWPGAFAVWNAQPLKILKSAVVDMAPGEPGRVAEAADGPVVACGAGGLLLLEVQPPGRRPMTATAYVRGARDFIGAKLG
jgi:methionyl-tRNA formyltransferase